LAQCLTHCTFEVAQGFAGEMGYMSRNVEKRLEPSRVLPDVRSIIVLGMNYYTSPAGPEASPGRGWISRYAWGQDYHTVLGDKLQALVACIRAIEGPDMQARWYVDTGPILERELAWRAGLGWPGKNTNLINRQVGPVISGRDITDRELVYDTPATAHCGTCTRCSDRMSHQGIGGARGCFDARRCISYLDD
jgi:epoxyqueuosine reductase